MAPVLSELVQELRRSLDYYRGKAGDAPVHEIWLTGGSAKLPNLAPFIESELGIPTRVASPFQFARVTSKNFSPDYLDNSASLFTIAVGLGTRDVIPAPTVAKPKPTKAPKAKK
jgi:type IV pilus assembly protein PilM